MFRVCKFLPFFKLCITKVNLISFFPSVSQSQTQKRQNVFNKKYSRFFSLLTVFGHPFYSFMKNVCCIQFRSKCCLRNFLSCWLQSTIYSEILSASLNTQQHWAPCQHSSKCRQSAFCIVALQIYLDFTLRELLPLILPF